MDHAKIWKLIPFQKYKVPTLPISSNFKSKMFSLFGIDFGGKEGGESKVKPKRDPVPKTLLNPTHCYDYSSLIEPILSLQIRQFFDDFKMDSGVLVFVTPPYSGLSNALYHWGEFHKWSELHPPSPEDLYQGDYSSLDDFMTGEIKKENRVIPYLETFFLRHPDNLEFMRHFLSRLSQGGRFVICCQSWAWAFLDNSIGISNILDNIWTLAPFDGEILKWWLPTLITAENAAGAILEISGGKKGTLSPNLEVIAANGRGIPGVCWSLFRRNLEYFEEGKKMGLKESDDFSQLSNLSVSRKDALILHHLLIHSQQPTRGIISLLPFSSGEIYQSLHQLELDNLITQAEGSWRVKSSSYPRVREYISNHGFFTDSF